jgi:hypothetical protein
MGLGPFFVCAVRFARSNKAWRQGMAALEGIVEATLA